MELSEEFEVKVGMHQVVVGVVTELAREGALSELLYADDLVLMSATIKGLRNNFFNGRRLLRARV